MLISITQNFITVCIQAIQLNVNVTFYRHSPETRSSSKLIVKMPNLHSKHKRSPTATKCINRAVSVANRKIAFLKKEKQELLRKNWSLKKSVLRRAKAQSCQTTPHKSTEMSMLTPRRQSRQQLREAGLAPRTVPVLRKRLHLHNAMVEGFIWRTANMPLSASSEHVAQAPGTEVALSCNSDECRRLHPGEHRRVDH